MRRLTAREAEALQGFEPDYTLIPSVRKKQRETGEEAARLLAYHQRTEGGRAAVEMRGGRVYATADGPRYRAIGNSMCVQVMRWIGRRIQIVDGLE